MSVEEVAEQIRVKAEKAGFDKSVKFDLGEDGKILLNGTRVSTEDAGSDCVIAVSLENLKAMAAGELNPTTAFMSGKLKVDGDLSAAMAVAEII